MLSQCSEIVSHTASMFRNRRLASVGAEWHTPAYASTITHKFASGSAPSSTFILQRYPWRNAECHSAMVCDRGFPFAYRNAPTPIRILFVLVSLRSRKFVSTLILTPLNMIVRHCPSSKQMGLLSVFHKGGSGSSLFDVKPLGVDGSSGGFGWSVFCVAHPVPWTQVCLTRRA